MGISHLIHLLSLFDKRVLLDQSELVTALHIMTNQTNITITVVWLKLRQKPKCVI